MTAKTTRNSTTTEIAHLHGIIVPLVTPLLQRYQLDEAGLEKLIDHVLTGEVSGLFILGTTGEGTSLSYKIRRQLIEKSCQINSARCPVLVGITDTSITESLGLAEQAADAGADAVVAAPPYYLDINQTELLHYYEKLAAELSLPLFLYNQPGNCKVAFEPKTVFELAQLDNIIGMKDSSKNTAKFQQAMHLLEKPVNLKKQDNFEKPGNFSFFMGPDSLMAQAVLSGAAGGVNAGANIHPKLYVELYQAAAAAQLETVHHLQSKVLRILSGIYAVSGDRLGTIKGLNCALNLMGIGTGFTIEPVSPLNAQQKNTIKTTLGELELI